MAVESKSESTQPAAEPGARIARITRRDVLKLSLGLSGLMVIQGLRRFMSYESAPPMVTRAVLDNPALYSVGSLTEVSEIRVWLGRDATGFYAFSGICTHLGCLIRQEEEQLTCPCHGSQFAPDGSVVQGPAALTLRHVEVSLSAESRLVIDTQVTVPPHQRLEPPI